MRRSFYLLFIAITLSTLSPVRAAGAIPKYIIIQLSTQQLTAYEGSVLFLSSSVSTGMPGWETPTGDFHIWAKRGMAEMIGPGYDLPGVPWIMYFNGDIAIHGTYWHTHFGHVFSHGCINVPTDVAERLYHWANADDTLISVIK